MVNTGTVMTVTSLPSTYSSFRSGRMITTVRKLTTRERVGVTYRMDNILLKISIRIYMYMYISTVFEGWG